MVKFFKPFHQICCRSFQLLLKDMLPARSILDSAWDMPSSLFVWIQNTMFAQGTLVTRAKLLPSLDPTPSLVSVYNWLYEWPVTQKTQSLELWREHAKETFANRHAKVIRQRACDKTRQRTLCPTLDNQESSLQPHQSYVRCVSTHA